MSPERAQPRVRAALDRLVHRGPDGEGLLLRAGCVLGMRRLAIIDVECGGQPIFNEDESVAVVCNGELYNYVELFEALEARGHRLQSHSDVNVLPHLYEERDTQAFDEVRGMFGAALWDERRQRLLLARDRAGKKPLFFAPVEHGVAFASELPALLALLNERPALDELALRDYLQLGFVPHPRTIYRGVSALSPGHTLTWTAETGIVIKQYWAPRVPAPFLGTREEAIEQLDAHLRTAVSLRLRSDVPVGLFLSGGIDSGLVASYAAELGASNLLCFVVEVDDPRLNEAELAKQSAARMGLPVEVIPLSFAPADAIERIASLYGQPFADSSAVPSYFVSKAASAHRKVVLNGDGGDEIFAGYRRYWAGAAAPWLVPLGSPLRLLGPERAGHFAGTIGRRSASGFAMRVIRGLSGSAHERYLVWTSDMLADGDMARYFPDLSAQKSPLSRLELERGYPLSADGLDAFQLTDYRLILADDLLPKMDIATMANSLEARSPFMDVPLAEFAWSLPAEWRITFRDTKPLLRTLAARRLPRAVADAPKRGFEAPVARWIKDDLRAIIDDTLLSSSSRVGELGDLRALTALVNQSDGFAGNHPQTVWMLLQLELFLRNDQLAPNRT